MGRIAKEYHINPEPHLMDMYQRAVNWCSENDVDPSKINIRHVAAASWDERYSNVRYDGECWWAERLNVLQSRMYKLIQTLALHESFRHKDKFPSGWFYAWIEDAPEPERLILAGRLHIHDWFCISAGLGVRWLTFACDCGSTFTEDNKQDLPFRMLKDALPKAVYDIQEVVLHPHNEERLLTV